MSITRRSFFAGSFSEKPLAWGATSIDSDLHLLNRITWGVRPQDVVNLKRIGKEAYLDAQLNPESLPDPGGDQWSQRFPLLEMDWRDLYRLDQGEGRAHRSLVLGMLARAIFSERQLLERMVDFWTDHFNVPADRPRAVVVFQREAIRKYALGNFHDLLMATAKQPAMLEYLDNAESEKEHPNENYARELMELHTLGVDGGYTEEDVREVARAFTGWTIHTRTRSGFYFDPEMHDEGRKVVLGRRLPSGRGIEDGLHVLSILADHPSTARYVSRKLCVKFVGDEPPEALVSSTAKVWGETHGDIRAVLRHIFMSDGFYLEAQPKLRRPLDFIVGAVRATGVEFTELDVLQRVLEASGQMPYDWHPPNGYPEPAGAWISSNGMLFRWNVAMLFTHHAQSAKSREWDTGRGVSVALHERIGDPKTVGELVEQVSEQVFGVALSEEHAKTFVNFASDGEGGTVPVTRHLLSRKLGSLFGLMLASPQYQYR